MARLLLSSTCTDFSFRGTSHLLHAVLTFLALFSGSSFPGVQTVSLQSVFGLEFLGVVQGVVDQSEPAGASTAKVGLEAEGKNYIGS